MSYPVSDDGNCPYCHSNNILYIVLVSNSNQNDSPAYDGNCVKSHLSTTDDGQESHDSQVIAEPSNDKLQQDDNQEKNREENKDTTCAHDKVETSASSVNSAVDEQYPDIIKSLLKIGRAYKVPEGKGEYHTMLQNRITIESIGVAR